PSASGKGIGERGVMISLLGAFLSLFAGVPGPAFESLGEPVRLRELTLEFVTRNAEGAYTAWSRYEGPEHVGLVGIRVATGEVVWVDTRPYGVSHVRAAQGAGGDLFLYSGNPGHFLRLEAATERLVDLGTPANPASYWMHDCVSTDGWFYVGSYPHTYLVRCHLQSGKVENLGRMTTDARQRYITRTAVSDDQVVYCAVGLHHRELWSYDTRTGEKRQILPPEMTRDQGAPSIWLGEDGQVYGQCGAVRFRCRPDSIEPEKTAQPRRAPAVLVAGDWHVGAVDAEGRLRLTHTKTGKVEHRQTRYAGSPRAIYCVGCERDGVLYGGTMFPARVFCFDTRAGRTEDLGVLTSSRIQVYDVLSHPSGLFLSSYMGASIDFFNPAAPRKKGENPRHIITVPGQERPTQLVTGPDGRVYTGTIPSKGRLGGALVRVDPADFSTRVWRDLVPNQSYLNLAPVPETGELLVTTTVGGGTSAIPTEKEAVVFLWDTAREAISFRVQPVPGTRSYGAVVRAQNGVIYGLAGKSYYAFDPKTRQVLYTGTLPVTQARFPGLSDYPVGPKGLIYGVGDDAVFAIDPADHSARVVARDASLKNAHGFLVTSDGTLYYGSGARLMRCRLAQ
ncbi:MAG: hypothetical protein QHJ73_11290, partial [Armatimonadota bacterium]|nr:hypothetical protein [Armatimonadota bacterium]